MASGAKLREIERLRGLAVMMVAACHWAPLHALLPATLQDPRTGVDLFFVISGYVVGTSLLRTLPAQSNATSFVEAFTEARAALRRFYTRRFFRIIPAALTIMLVVRVGVGHVSAFGTSKAWGEEVLAFAGGVYTYLLAFKGGADIFRHYWSLTVEEHFYLLLPIVFVLARTQERRIVAGAAVALASMTLRLLPPPDGAEVYSYYMHSSHLRFATPMAGALLALLPRATTPPPPAMMPPAVMHYAILPFALLALATLPGVLINPVYLGIGLVSSTLLSALVVHFASLDRGYVFEIPGLGRALEFVGSRSYGIYLTHQAVEHVETAVRAKSAGYAGLVSFTNGSPWRQFLLLSGLTLVTSELLYRLVERPFIDLGRKLTATPRDAIDAAPAVARALVES